MRLLPTNRPHDQPREAMRRSFLARADRTTKGPRDLVHCPGTATTTNPDWVAGMCILRLPLSNSGLKQGVLSVNTLVLYGLPG
jgi:hypothetical protein